MQSRSRLFVATHSNKVMNVNPGMKEKNVMIIRKNDHANGDDAPVAGRLAQPGGLMPEIMSHIANEDDQ